MNSNKLRRFGLGRIANYAVPMKIAVLDARSAPIEWVSCFIPALRVAATTADTATGEPFAARCAIVCCKSMLCMCFPARPLDLPVGSARARFL